MTPADIAAKALEAMHVLRKSIEDSLVGRDVRVTSDHNGQPFGRSRKSWRGQVCRIKYIHVDLAHPDRGGGIQLCLEGHEYGECFIPAAEVEFV